METSFQLRSVDAVRGTSYLTKPVDRTAKGVQEEVAIENARALTEALRGSPAVRDDVVRRATELVGDVNYPPAETIRMISHLLAIQMHPDSDGDAS